MSAKRTHETPPAKPERKPAPAHDTRAPQSWGAPRSTPAVEPRASDPMHTRFPKTWAAGAWSDGAWSSGAWSPGAFK
jgi:hypothetical protein